MRIALFEPDIPQNTGAILRLAACLGVGVDIIEPCGFTFSKQRLRRSGMDYLEHVDFKLHQSWEDFYDSRVSSSGRLLLLTTKSNLAYTSFDFHDQDTLLFGRESAGVPKSVHDNSFKSLKIPLKNKARSLNVGMAAAITLVEALKQNSIL